MDGVFMVKFLKRVSILALLVALVWCGMLLADRQKLHEELIRLHVVADSDLEEDQQIKLQVKDAIVASLRQGMQDVTDVNQAKAYLEEHLPQLESLANQVLKAIGSDNTATVSLTEEAFPTREYDTFSLPAGVYDALRVVIGEGQGRNWWCVVFPQLCLPSTVSGFEDAAVGSGFSDDLAGALTGEDGYEVRFFFLDCLGRIENFFHRG